MCVEMKITIVIGLIFIFYHSNGQPSSACSENQIFRLSDTSCASFKETCYKEGDEQCKKLEDGCKQCPPSNLTLIMLKNIWKRLTNSSSSETNITRSSKSEPNIANTYSPYVEIKGNDANAFHIAMVVLLIIVIIISMENRFKFITKYIQSSTDKEKLKYKLLKSRKLKYQDDMNKKNYKELKELVMKIDSNLQELQNRVNKLQMESSDIQFTTVKFPLEGINHKYIELYVHNNHNIVQVKQRLCTSLLNAKQDDYKRMKLKYNGDILDDNEYLLKCINPENPIVHYIIDATINANEIVVVNLNGKMRVPDIIQIRKNQKIAELKSIIAKIIKSNEFVIFKELIDNKMLKLEENHTVNYYNLMDGDLLNVITIETGELVIRSIFDENVSCIIQYCNTDLISSLAEAVKRNFQPKCQDVILFLQNNKLNEEKFVFQLRISNESPVKFCGFMEYEGIQTEGKSIENGAFWELYNAFNKRTNKKILIKKYKLNSEINWKDNENVLNELKTFQITKSNRRFIQLLGVCNEALILYVVMENMAGGTLKTYLKKHDSLGKNAIYKWSAQILEGLKFLHEHKVIHRDLNPSSILVDENTDLKLSSFNLSKYENIYGQSSIIGKSNQSNQLKVRYMAPEILSSKEYGVKCDVWSFGAVLIRIVSGKKPYNKCSKGEAIKKIKNSTTIIEYEFLNKSLDSDFKSFIDSCLRSEPKQRETIEKLIENECIKPFISNIDAMI